MKFEITFMIFTFASSVFAGPTQVSFDEKRYEVNLTKDFLAFNEDGFTKKVKKQKCNRALIEQFEADLNANKTNLIEAPKSGVPKGAIKVLFDGKTKFALRFASEGKYFSDLPSKAKNLWITSERVCVR